MENDPCIKRSGILLLDKPEGLSSNQCVQKVRHQFNKVKAGHTGNLDPLATGLLPICLGEATRFSQYLLDADKTYQARMQFGYESSTGDAEGEITAIKPEQSVSEAQLLKVCQQFTGAIEQIPPMYSALKHQGTPLYKLAREGKEVERKVRHVEIFELQLQQLQPGYADIHVRCSKGTYIRTLVEDMGRALGCGAYMSALRRTAVAPLTGEMVSLNDLQTMACEDKLQWIQPVDTMLKHMNTLNVDAGQVSDLMHGKPVQVEEEEISDSPQLKRLYQQGQFVGLAHHHQHMLQVKRMIQDLSV